VQERGGVREQFEKNMEKMKGLRWMLQMEVSNTGNSGRKSSSNSSSSSSKVQ